MERSKYDMSYEYFQDMAPESPVITSSTLMKYRKLRLLDLIGKIQETGMKAKTVIGAAVYSRKDNILYTNKNELVSKLTPQITQSTCTKEEAFEFNEDDSF